MELWRAGRVFFPLERAVVMVLLTVEEESVFLLHTLTEGSGMPLSNRTTPANGSKIDQGMPLLDSVKVNTNKRGRLRKPLKVLAADKGYDSKDNRAALRRRGIRPQWSKGVWKTKNNEGKPIQIFVPSDNKNVVSHG
ncbi:MAG: transposase [Richelia sp.]|nr:transposase [Richelia sp.]